METVKLTTWVDDDGVLRLELPMQLAGNQVEVLVVVQPLPSTINEPTDALGWPIGYFEETYGILADDPIERGDQGEFEVRESFD